MKDRILLIGLGNILLRDEGVGVHVIHILKERYHFGPSLEIIDGGTLGLDLLPFLETCDKVLFVDAINFGREPGYVGEIEDDAIPSAFQTKLSVHHIGVADLFLAAKWMDLKLANMCLIGIQPQSIEMGLEMTDCITDKLEELMDRVFQRLKGWGATCAVQSS